MSLLICRSMLNISRYLDGGESLSYRSGEAMAEAYFIDIILVCSRLSGKFTECVHVCACVCVCVWLHGLSDFIIGVLVLLASLV